MKYFTIDVFTDELFKGNPAGVCLLDRWIGDDILQKIAFENNLSDTAFIVERNGYYDLRWFTPKVEVDLCGHATLASGFVLTNFVDKNTNEVRFETKSGRLTVKKEDDLYILDFPSRPVTPTEKYITFEKAFKCKNIAVMKALDFMVVFENEQIIYNLQPDFAVLKQIKDEAMLDTDGFGIIVTAKGDNCDFVSRFFAPNMGIDEDPVTGRAHCTLIPYWSEKLGKIKMNAVQLSQRGGRLYCENAGERVKIGGKAVCYLTGEINI